MDVLAPATGTVRSALQLALRAPSIHNTQPWLWSIGNAEVRLFADPQRWLPATDPDERDLLVSCGAALHHARVALAAFGWGCEVRLRPDPAESLLLATLHLRPRRLDPDEAQLAEAIPVRRSVRRGYADRPVGSRLLTALVTAASAQGARLEAAAEPYARAVLTDAIAAADNAQSGDYGYRQEMRRWSHRPVAYEDGIPPEGAVTAAGYGDVRLRDLSPGEIPTLRPAYPAGAGELLVLSTLDDGAQARLLAGQAASAVLLTATRHGLLTCPLSQPLEVRSAKRVVAQIAGDGSVPQLVIRVGHPVPGTPLPPVTPRRPLRAVLVP